MINVGLCMLSALWNIGLPQSRHWVFLILFGGVVRALLGKIELAGLSKIELAGLSVWRAMRNDGKCLVVIKGIVMVCFRWIWKRKKWECLNKNAVRLENENKHMQNKRTWKGKKEMGKKRLIDKKESFLGKITLDLPIKFCEHLKKITVV